MKIEPVWESGKGMVSFLDYCSRLASQVPLSFVGNRIEMGGDAQNMSNVLVSVVLLLERC